jgi:hypothetical protein
VCSETQIFGGEGRWLSFFHSKSDSLTKLELEKLSEEEVPQFMRRPNPPNDEFYKFNDRFESRRVGPFTTNWFQCGWKNGCQKTNWFHFPSGYLPILIDGLLEERV